MRLPLILRFAALALGLLGAVSCSDVATNAPTTGKVSLLLKDAAGIPTTAWVTISEIDLQGSGGTLVLLHPDKPFSTDLLTLSNDVTTLVQGAVIPAGTYTQLRFVITSACILVPNDGIYATTPVDKRCGDPTGTLQTPSYDQSGLKVILPNGGLVVSSGADESLVVDFDVSQSFGQVAGKSGQWVMHPVIKATDVALTGSIHVTLTPEQGFTPPDPLSAFTATITSTTDPTVTKSLPLSDTGGMGVVDFHYLLAGDYTVTVTGTISVPTTVAPASQTVTVPAGGSVTAPFTLSQGTPQTPST